MFQLVKVTVKKECRVNVDFCFPGHCFIPSHNILEVHQYTTILASVLLFSGRYFDAQQLNEGFDYWAISHPVHCSYHVAVHNCFCVGNILEDCTGTYEIRPNSFVASHFPAFADSCSDQELRSMTKRSNWQLVSIEITYDVQSTVIQPNILRTTTSGNEQPNIVLLLDLVPIYCEAYIVSSFFPSMFETRQSHVLLWPACRSFSCQGMQDPHQSRTFQELA